MNLPMHLTWPQQLPRLASWSARSFTTASPSWHAAASQFQRPDQRHGRPSASERSDERERGSFKSNQRSRPVQDGNPLGPSHQRTPARMKRIMASRIQSQDTSSFYKGGVLETTAENAYFLRDTGIEPDHGALWVVRHPEAAALFKRMGVQVSFSNRYALNPHHLRLFQPRGDPWMGRIRSQYREMLETKPLWVHACAWGKQPAIVRFSCSRRLKACAYRAAVTLKEKDPALEARGTVLIAIRDVYKAVNWDSQQFYEMMVLALEEEMRLFKAGL